MTIAEQVRGLAEGHAAALPAEVMSAFAREQPELAALEPVEVIAVGELLPDSDLLDAHGHATTLRMTLDGRPRSVGILTAPSQEARAAQLQLGLDLETVNADGTAAIPMPTVLILAPDLTVRWVDVHPDYTAHSEPAEILAALDAITT